MMTCMGGNESYLSNTSLLGMPERKSKCPYISAHVPSLPLKKKRCYVFIFTEQGREGEREGEKHQCVVASHATPTGDLACNPDMCHRLGNQPVIIWFAGPHSIHGATPARTPSLPSLYFSPSHLMPWQGLMALERKS